MVFIFMNVLPAWMAVLVTSYMVAFPPGGMAVEPRLSPVQNWKDLPAASNLYPPGGAIYYSFDLNGSKVHLAVVNYKSARWKLVPALNESTAATSTTAEGHCATAAVNGGYFNLKDSGASTSYLVIDGKQAADPHTNKLLVGNPKLAPYLETIFNRSEVRFLQKWDKPEIEIAHHNDPLPAGTRLISSLQAGPQLLPELTARQEAFVRTDPDGSEVDSIGTYKTAARTAFGITPDGYAMILTVAGSGQDPESTGLSLVDLAKLMKDLGCISAINFDGGASSTMSVRLDKSGSTHELTTVCGKIPETRVKSVLMVVPAAAK